MGQHLLRTLTFVPPERCVAAGGEALKSVRTRHLYTSVAAAAAPQVPGANRQELGQSQLRWAAARRSQTEVRARQNLGLVIGKTHRRIGSGESTFPHGRCVSAEGVSLFANSSDVFMLYRFCSGPG